MSLTKKVCLALLLSITVVVSAQTAPAGGQTETDEYTRYELQQPETASFKIYYEVTATTAGAKFYSNCRTAESGWTTGMTSLTPWTCC
jgi:hypothetical protein